MVAEETIQLDSLNFDLHQHARPVPLQAWRRVEIRAIFALALLVGLALLGQTGVFAHLHFMTDTATRPAGLPETGEMLFADDFNNGLTRWRAELEDGGAVTAKDGKLVIDVPAGCTVWFEPKIEGPVVIEYEATVIDQGGPNDRVSDLNCFWMARDARNPDDLLAVERSGKFADYNQLKCYYVGYGGNTNSTTRFRRYIGEQDRRPLLPEHDLRDERYLIEPNHTYAIRLVANGPRIEYWRDGEKIFDFEDPEPYTSGWFGLRTVTSHIEFDNFRVRRVGSRTDHS